MSTAWHKYFTPQATEMLIKSIDLALEEDGPDLSSEGIFDGDHELEANLVAKEDTFIVGLPLIGIVLKRLNVPFTWKPLIKEGSEVKKGDIIAVIKAPAAALLKGERIILNYITHLSGIANLTNKYVEELEDTGVKLLDTRKTLPGLRWPEKYAVQMAGGKNHRMSLTDMLMLKDNHIDGAGSITEAIAILRKKYQPCPPIEVECRTKSDVMEALLARADRIMLDNMSGELLKESLMLAPENTEIEVSGGVTLDNIRKIATCCERKPNFISVGRLTHSARAADLSMKILKR